MFPLNRHEVNLKRKNLSSFIFISALNVILKTQLNHILIERGEIGLRTQKGKRENREKELFFLGVRYLRNDSMRHAEKNKQCAIRPNLFFRK